MRVLWRVQCSDVSCNKAFTCHRKLQLARYASPVSRQHNVDYLWDIGSTSGKPKLGWDMFGLRNMALPTWTGVLRRCCADPLREETTSGVPYIVDGALRH